MYIPEGVLLAQLSNIFDNLAIGSYFINCIKLNVQLDSCIIPIEYV